jgi:hypothetical protein
MTSLAMSSNLMDASTLSALLIGAASLVGWMVTQTQARSRAQRDELRRRRRLDILRIKYTGQLEEEMTRRNPNMSLPVKPKGLAELEREAW